MPIFHLMVKRYKQASHLSILPIKTQKLPHLKLLDFERSKLDAPRNEHLFETRPPFQTAALNDEVCQVRPSYVPLGGPLWTWCTAKKNCAAT